MNDDTYTNQQYSENLRGIRSDHNARGENAPLPISVLIGSELRDKLEDIPLITRYCYTKVMDYVHDISSKVCYIYGLRRTGKSTLMFQAIRELGVDNCAYIMCNKNTTISHVEKSVEFVRSLNIKYIFIDEITFVSGLLARGARFSDIEASSKCRIVLSGTYSLLLRISSLGVLYDRAVVVNTTYTSYTEYKHLYENACLDDYLKHGCILSKEWFSDKENVDDYIQTSIADNIDASLKKCVSISTKYPTLQEYISAGNAITPLINYIVNKYTVGFLPKLFMEDFVSADLCDAETQKFAGEFLKELHTYEVDDEVRGYCSIPNTHLDIDVKVLEDLKRCLYDMHVFNHITHWNENQYEEVECLIFQGLRYQILLATIKSLCARTANKERVESALENAMLGHVLEEHIIFHCKQAGAPVFHIDVQNRSYDMVRRVHGGFIVYEIKHSSNTPVHALTQLLDKEWEEEFTNKFGAPIVRKVCLYNGSYREEGGIQFLNIETFLSEFVIDTLHSPDVTAVMSGAEINAVFAKFSVRKNDRPFILSAIYAVHPREVLTRMEMEAFIKNRVYRGCVFPEGALQYLEKHGYDRREWISIYNDASNKYGLYFNLNDLIKVLNSSGT